MESTTHPTTADLESALEHIRESPGDQGTLELIVRRPAVDERKVLERAELNPADGLAGDSWNARSTRQTEDGSPHPDAQLTLMNARAAQIIAGSPERWPLAGDQLYVDLDLSPANLPPGTRLKIGEAVVEITALPHRGCKKFKVRFGVDALKFVNSEAGVSLNLRGIYAKVVRPGGITQGDSIRKVPAIDTDS